MTRQDEHERGIFWQAFDPPPEEERQGLVDLDSSLELSLAEYRARLARGEVELIDPVTGTVTFHPVDDD